MKFPSRPNRTSIRRLLGRACRRNGAALVAAAALALSGLFASVGAGRPAARPIVPAARQTHPWREPHTLAAAPNQRPSHADEVRCVALSHDGRLAVSGSRDFQIKLWTVASGKEV